MAGEAPALQGNLSQLNKRALERDQRCEIRNPKSRKPHVFPRIHFEIKHQRILRVRLNDFLYEFHVDRIVLEHGELIHRLKIDGDEEWPIGFRVDSFAAFDAQDFGNLQELHPRVHHHLLDASGGDLSLQFVENDMVNHEGKANRRFPRTVQVRIRAQAELRIRDVV